MAALAIALALALMVTGEAPPTCQPRAAPPSVQPRTCTADGGRRLAVLVRIDTQALERHVNVSDVIREIRALWTPYADNSSPARSPAALRMKSATTCFARAPIRAPA
jgi:hypothetical protein